MPGSTSKPSKYEIEILSQYARLVEDLGAEAISKGVSEALLPAGKNELSNTIARLSLNPKVNTMLKSDDLVKLYGALEMFFPVRDFDIISAAYQVNEQWESGEEIDKDSEYIMEHGTQILSDAVSRFHDAAINLKNHAASVK